MNKGKIRRDLIALFEHGPDTHVGQVSRDAAEYIRQLENEVEDLRSFARTVRAAVNGQIPNPTDRR